MALRARVKNFCGVASAEVEIADITLIGGSNAAGKSSLLQGVAAAALQQPGWRGVSRKTDMAMLVREGAEGASVLLDYGPGQIRISWPASEATVSGTPKQLGSPLGIGAVRFSTLRTETRSAELSARLNMEPTRLDLAAFLAKRGFTDEATITALWERIEASGWASVHKAMAEHVTKLKGRWEQASNTRWGEKKAADWRPTNLFKDEVYVEAECVADLDRAKEERDRILAAGAISQAEIQRVKDAAADLEPARGEVARLESEVAREAAALEALIEAHEKLPVPPPNNGSAQQKCPHCLKPLGLKRGDGSSWMIVAGQPTLRDDELRQMRLAYQTSEHAIAKASRDIDALRSQVVEAQRRQRDAEAAVARLAEIEAQQPATRSDLEAAQRKVAEAEATLKAVQAMQAARAIYEDWLMHQPLLAALAPEGVRAERALHGLETLNQELADLCATAEWPVVLLDPDLEVRVDSRPWNLLSESEQWRADLLLTLALARREGAALVLVDRFDVLAPQLRPGAFKALRQAAVPALVACTVKNRDALPNLKQAGFGRCWWMEAGILSPV